MCEKWFAESYVKVYADFHEVGVVLVLSHRQKYSFFTWNDITLTQALVGYGG